MYIDKKELKKYLVEIVDNLDEKELKKFIKSYGKKREVFLKEFLNHFYYKLPLKSECKIKFVIRNSVDDLSKLIRRGNYLINSTKTKQALAPIKNLLKEYTKSFDNRIDDAFVLSREIFEIFDDADLYEHYEATHIADLVHDALELLKELLVSDIVSYEFKNEVSDYLKEVVNSDEYKNDDRILSLYDIPCNILGDD
jgi:hypothetical protein